MTVKDVPVKKLEDIFCILADDDEPDDVWGTNVTLEDVMNCIKHQVFETISYHEALLTSHRDNYNHAARIAFLVLNKDESPIDLDVGCPSLGYYDVTLTDGNHRTVAAIIRGDKTIKANVSGEMGYFRHLFIRKSKNYAEI